jgi:ribosome-binding ATPase YchF (GTP1/OBG family)
MGQESSAAVLAHLRTVDVLLVVVGAFAAGRSPASDLEEFNLELQLADLGQIEKRLERLEKELRLGSKGTPAERAARERELAVLRRLQPVLEEGKPARTVELSRDELREIASFGFLTLKPTLVVANLGDDQDPAAVLAALEPHAGAVAHTAVLGVPARLEMELGELSPEDAAEFKEALGAGESQLGEVIRCAYSCTPRRRSARTRPRWTISPPTPRDAAGSIHRSSPRLHPPGDPRPARSRAVKPTPKSAAGYVKKARRIRYRMATSEVQRAKRDVSTVVCRGSRASRCLRGRQVLCQGMGRRCS